MHQNTLKRVKKHQKALYCLSICLYKIFFVLDKIRFVLDKIFFVHDKKGIVGIFCVRLLMDMTAFPGPIFKSRTIFGNDFPSRFQICGRNFQFPTFRVRKSWKTLLFRRLINCVWLLMDMSAFPGPIFKSRTIFGNDFSSRFQICGQNFKFSILESYRTPKDVVGHIRTP